MAFQILSDVVTPVNPTPAPILQRVFTVWLDTTKVDGAGNPDPAWVVTVTFDGGIDRLTMQTQLRDYVRQALYNKLHP